MSLRAVQNEWFEPAFHSQQHLCHLRSDTSSRREYRTCRVFARSPRARMVRRIVGQVTPLTEKHQVLVAIVARNVVQVGAGADDPYPVAGIPQEAGSNRLLQPDSAPRQLNQRAAVES